jgi:hypothetical protein
LLIVAYWIPPLIDRSRREDSNGGVVEISVIFRHDGQFFARQMVKLSSLHDEGGPAEVFYHHRRDILVIALQMAVLPLILGVIFIFTLLAWLGGNIKSTVCLLLGRRKQYRYQ